MRGKAVFYPIGWDDNGLPTERRVQNYYGVRCDPALPYDPAVRAAASRRAAGEPVPVSRRNFVELCRAADRPGRAGVRRRPGGGSGCRWTGRPSTRPSATGARAVAQRAFLRNLARGEAYLAEAPTLWDVTSDRGRPGRAGGPARWPAAYHRVAFRLADGRTARRGGGGHHPARAAARLRGAGRAPGRRAVRGAVRRPTVPRRCSACAVPVLAHPLAEPDKGTGIAMVCTFGDLTDVTWWRDLDLPTRPCIGRDGRLLRRPPAGIARPGRAAYAAAGRADRVRGPGRGSPTCCADAGDLRGEPRPVTHAVKFYEKGDTPLEIVTTRQWYIRNGGRDPDLRERAAGPRPGAGLAPGAHAGPVRELGGRAGRRLADQPAAVLRRADPGLVPAGRRRRAALRRADPCPPRTRCRSTRPPSRRPATTRTSAASRAGSPADPDVMDTWATSSLTPQIAAGWGSDDDLFAPGVPDGPAAAGARDHPDLAVLHGAALARRSSACCPGGTPRSPAGSSTRTGRRCPSPRATW